MLHVVTGRDAPLHELRWQFRWCCTLACVLLTSLPAFAYNQQQEKFAEYKEKYEKETDPIRKAKALGNYGDAQIAEFSRAASVNDFDTSFNMLSAYRNEVRVVFDSLKTTGNDAEKKPDGFKDLQIHLRKSLWEIDRTIPFVPADRRPDFQTIRDDLGRIQGDLILLLFPREPGKRKSGTGGAE
jgi:hypothetical protein